MAETMYSAKHYAIKSQKQAQLAESNTENSRAWAVGNLKERPEGSAKYWAEYASSITGGTLNQTQITNGITKIPQDIKLELSNGVLTLKAGSKVYIPNGVGVFDEVTIQEDKVALSSGANGKVYLFVRDNGVDVYCNQAVSEAVSGTTPPTFKGLFYNTSENKIDFYDNGTLADEGFSLPLAVVTASADRVLSIDQVFNGFGYIGSTAFGLPNIEGLIPNGRNTDGSLNNIRLKTTSVSISPTYQTGAYSNRQYLFIYNGNTITDNIGFYESDVEPANWTGKAWFDTRNNLIKYKDGGGNIITVQAVMFGTCSVSNGRITSLIPKNTFQAVDRNELPNIVANTNLSNVTPEGRKASVSWGVPDYSLGTTRTYNTTYNESVDGVLIATPKSRSGAGGWSITIAEQTFDFNQGYSGTDYSKSTCGYFTIPKGVNYKLAGDNNSTFINFKFFPFKGAN